MLADGLSLPLAAGLVRSMAALRDPGEAVGAVPSTVRLLDLLDLPAPDGPSVRTRWARAGPVPRVVIGQSADGPFAVDLDRDGPHGLVAGTTGAGKSEFLQCLLGSLAATYPPSELAFVLIDYKGGAAFRDCARLPHTLGLVTDLDEHLTRRALRSLRAELTRREAVLAAAGVSDLPAYRALARRAPAPGAGATLGPPANNAATDGGAASPLPLPRLLLVIDEFAALAGELPDFVSGLVGIAARGRSLGIHLILATQRPAGCVTPAIRANASLRIALRVIDESESRDIVEVRGAEVISKHAPGRALIRSGADPPVPVQTARITGRAPPADAAPRVRAVRWPGHGDPRPLPPVAECDGAGDLPRLVTAVRAAAESTGWQPLPSPWLPPVPDVLDLDEVPAAPPGCLALGLVDHPDEQRRSVLAVDLAAGSVLVAGGPRSGRSTALRTLIAALIRSGTAEQVHVHVLDCAGGGLGAVGQLPHCGTVVGRDDVVRGRRLLARLAGELDTRQRAGDSAARPRVTLVLDGWEPFVQAYEPIEAGRPVDELLRLAREGPQAGMPVVVAGDRSGLGGRLAGALRQRIVLPLTDRGDYSLAGITTRAVPAHRPPGRGLLPDTGLECQVAVLGGRPSARAEALALAGIASHAPPPLRHPPLTVRELPERVPLDSLAPARKLLSAVLGAGGDDAAPVVLDLGLLGPGFLLAGPARSGKSTALLTLAHGLLGSGTPVVAVTGRRSVLRSAPAGVEQIGPEDVGALRAAVAIGSAVVLVDDLEALLDSAADPMLSELLRADRGITVVGAGRSEDRAGGFRGVGVELRRRRCGVLLTPSPANGELLGVRLPRGLAERTPGRGYLVENGTLTRVQVADSSGFSPGAGTPPSSAARRSP